MPDPQKKYDELSDTLHISFSPGTSGTGIELNDNILLRIDKREQVAVSLSIFNYSILAQRTELGLPSVPLTGLTLLSDDLREMALRILQDAPVHNYLSLLAYTPGGIAPIPITHLLPAIIPSQAA